MSTSYPQLISLSDSSQKKQDRLFKFPTHIWHGQSLEMVFKANNINHMNLRGFSNPKWGHMRSFIISHLGCNQDTSLIDTRSVSPDIQY